MHTQSTRDWQHTHTFGQEQTKAGERRTCLVIAITAVTMVVEVVAGVTFGSMALLADGLHMATHTAALGIAALAYAYARRHTHDRRFSFGTGKIGALAGFTSAILLAGFALIMAWESMDRMLNPVRIVFDQAILVAVLGLAVNAASMVILGGGHDHRETQHGHEHGHDHHYADHNLRGAYLHVLADALTSLLAIVALLAGKFLGLNWMDPCMGIVGALLVARWAWGLLRDTSAVLLDRQAPASIHEAIQASIEHHADNRIADLHVWAIGSEAYAGIISLVTDDPKPPAYYKTLLPDGLGVVHTTVEVHQCRP
jgi:cation diffusion facilitator family transporter